MKEKDLEFKLNILVNERNLIYGIVIGLVTSFITNLYIALIVANFEDALKSFLTFLFVSILLIVLCIIIYRWIGSYQKACYKLLSDVYISEVFKKEEKEILKDKKKINSEAQKSSNKKVNKQK
jgi:hypothetical protein